MTPGRGVSCLSILNMSRGHCWFSNAAMHSMVRGLCSCEQIEHGNVVLTCLGKELLWGIWLAGGCALASCGHHLHSQVSPPSWQMHMSRAGSCLSELQAEAIEGGTLHSCSMAGPWTGELITDFVCPAGCAPTTRSSGPFSLPAAHSSVAV